MKPRLVLYWGSSLVGAVLLSSCASHPKSGGSCCASGGSASAALAPVSSGSKAESYRSMKGGVGASAIGAASVKVREQVIDSTQHEIVRETKPVIGDDSELRR